MPVAKLNSPISLFSLSQPRFAKGEVTAQIGGSKRWTVSASLAVPLRAVTASGEPLVWSAVLAALRFEQALSQVVREGDDANGDIQVLECAGCPGSCAGLERRCGQRVAQAQDQLRPRVDGGGYPGQLEGIGQHLVPLRALGRSLVRPALNQDRPARAGTIDLDALPGRDGDGGGIQLAAQLRAEQVQHHPFRAALLSGIPGRHSPGIQDGAGTGESACPGNGSAHRSWAASGFPVRVPEPFVDDLAIGSGRRRTIPSRSSARQIWFTVCRGEMPACAAT